MKTKPTKNKRGRKKFSVGRLLSPDKELEENMTLAGIGKFATATQPDDRAIFSLVGLWKNYYAPAFTEANAASPAARIIRERFTKIILRIIKSALDRLDTKPFETFVRSIKFMQDAKRSGPLLHDTYEVLRVANEMNLTTGPNTVQTISPKEFKARLEARLGRKINERHFARIKGQIGLHFKSGKPKG
jgi:hypothetical protein